MNSQILLQFGLDDLRQLLTEEREQARRDGQNRLLSKAEICRELGINPRTFDKLDMPMYPVGKTIRYRLADVPRIKKLTHLKK